MNSDNVGKPGPKQLHSGNFGNDPGQRKPLGRPKGTPNKVTALIKNTFMKVFQDLQQHETANLQSWAESEPTEFYKLASKFIPTEVDAVIKETITVRLFDDEDLSEEEEIEDVEVVDFEDISPDEFM